MKLYFAPLEGITDGIYRRVFQEHFGGVDKYYAPFISPTADFHVTHRERRQLLIDSDAPYTVVPQLLIRETEGLPLAFRRLQEFGFREINLNLGCPSSTVTAKGKGAGLLRDLPALRRLLDSAFSQRGDLCISAKTRIGYSSVEEWPEILKVLEQYPFSELIVHPRTREEYYRGPTHPELLMQCRDTGFPVIYNGDIFSPQDAAKSKGRYCFLEGLMLGRGLVANPGLAQMLRGQPGMTAEKWQAFHGALAYAYAEEMPFHALHGRLCEIIAYMSRCFENSKKAVKLMRKAHSMEEYLQVSKVLFEDCPLRQEPFFDAL